MDSNEILTILKSEKQILQSEFGVKKIALFGSYSKNEQTENSDIDLYVEMQISDYSLLMNLYSFLESKLNAKIDLIRKARIYQVVFLII